jgi:hypothetical protein
MSAAAPAARGQIQPNPREIYIYEISAAGNGSPAGCVMTNLAPDGRAINVLYDSFNITYDAAETITKTSTVTLKMHLPSWHSGWSFTPFYIDTHGYADIEGNVTATITTQAAIETSEGVWGEYYPLASTILNGPFEGDYFKRCIDTLGLWLPDANGMCNYRINTTLEISGTGYGYASVDSLDGDLGQTEFVPEPSSLAMLLGIALTALLYWRRKHA